MKNNTITAIVSFLMLISFYGYSKPEQEEGPETAVKFYTGSLQEALKLAKETNKPIMMDITTGWCMYCKKMKKYTFADKTAADYFNEKFINLEIDAEKGEGISIAQKYEVSSYPTLIFIDKNEKLLLFSEGYLKPDGLIETGKMALKNLKP